MVVVAKNVIFMYLFCGDTCAATVGCQDKGRRLECVPEGTRAHRR